MVKVYAPASSANMSVGFDVLGAAVTPVDGSLLGDTVTVEAAESFSLNNVGRFASKLPSDPRENIVYQCWERFCQEIGKNVPVAMTLEKSMPIGSGLGSSACSVVAALVAGLVLLALFVVPVDRVAYSVLAVLVMSGFLWISHRPGRYTGG